MGSLLGNWPSRDPHIFSQIRPADSAEPSNYKWENSNLTATTYYPTHNRTHPPPNQVISTEETNILLRHFYQKADEKMRPKRAASDNLRPNHVVKLPRGSWEEGSSSHNHNDH